MKRASTAVCWLVVLSAFEMTEIAHIPGAQNIPADVLSRYPDSNGPSYEHLIPEQGNMDVRFNSVQIAEQEYLFSLLQLANLETPVEVSEQSQVPGTAEITPHSLPTPARLFSETGSSGTADVPTLLPTPERSDSNDSAGHATSREPNAAVCPHCRSSTCDTLQDEFTRHAIEPELTAGATIDDSLESGFSGVSQVSAGADVEAFVEGYTRSVQISN